MRGSASHQDSWSREFPTYGAGEGGCYSPKRRQCSTNKAEFSNYPVGWVGMGAPDDLKI